MHVWVSAFTEAVVLGLTAKLLPNTLERPSTCFHLLCWGNLWGWCGLLQVLNLNIWKIIEKHGFRMLWVVALYGEAVFYHLSLEIWQPKPKNICSKQVLSSCGCHWYSWLTICLWTILIYFISPRHWFFKSFPASWNILVVCCFLIAMSCIMSWLFDTSREW